MLLNKIKKFFKEFFYCKYRNRCPHYQPTGSTCTKNPGPYCGKWREFNAEKQDIKEKEKYETTK